MAGKAIMAVKRVRGFVKSCADVLFLKGNSGQERFDMDASPSNLSLCHPALRASLAFFNAP